MTKSTTKISDLSNWNPMKVRSMFPSLTVDEPTLDCLKGNYLKEENRTHFDSFYSYLEYQEKQRNQSLRSIASDS